MHSVVVWRVRPCTSHAVLEAIGARYCDAAMYRELCSVSRRATESRRRRTSAAASVPMGRPRFSLALIPRKHDRLRGGKIRSPYIAADVSFPGRKDRSCLCLFPLLSSHRGAKGTAFASNVNRPGRRCMAALVLLLPVAVISDDKNAVLGRLVTLYT